MRGNPSCPRIQTNSRLARRAVSIVIAPWRAPDLGRVGGDVGDSGSPYAQGKHHPAMGCHVPGRRPGSRPGPHLDQNVLVGYATVALASILDPSGGLFSDAARPCQRPAPPFGANVVPWCITLDNSKGISRLRFWCKNSRVNGINDLPVFMHQGSDTPPIGTSSSRPTGGYPLSQLHRTRAKRGQGRHSAERFRTPIIPAISTRPALPTLPGRLTRPVPKLGPFEIEHKSVA